MFGGAVRKFSSFVYLTMVKLYSELMLLLAVMCLRVIATVGVQY